MHKRAQTPVKPKLQSREATATEFDVNIRTVDKMIQDGRLKSVRVGRRHMVVCESAEAIIAGE